MKNRRNTFPSHRVYNRNVSLDTFSNEEIQNFDANDINNIEIVTSIVSDSEKINCPICQTECVTQVRKTLCNHSFCDECISRWLSKSKKCPSCMRDLEDLLSVDT